MQAALELFEATWDELVGSPSSGTASDAEQACLSPACNSQRRKVSLAANGYVYTVPRKMGLKGLVGWHCCSCCRVTIHLGLLAASTRSVG